METTATQPAAWRSRPRNKYTDRELEAIRGTLDMKWAQAWETMGEQVRRRHTEKSTLTRWRIEKHRKASGGTMVPVVASRKPRKQVPPMADMDARSVLKQSRRTLAFCPCCGVQVEVIQAALNLL